MAENSRVSKDKQAGTDRKHHAQQQDSRPAFEDIRAWDHDLISLTETPFHPPMEEHAAFLAAAPPGPPLTNFMQHLQRTYGNAYVQRLLKHGVAQAEDARASNAGNDMVSGPGQYLSGTVEMENPLANEPAHVRQRDIDRRGQGYATLVMRKIPTTSREILESEKIPKLKPETVENVKKMLGNPDKRQEAINIILKETGLENGLGGIAGHNMEYVPDLKAKCKISIKSTEDKEWETTRGITGREWMGVDIHVYIGPKAFQSVPILYATLYHEYAHVKQQTAFETGPTGPASEVEAYYFGIKAASITGIAADIREVTGNFENLHKEYQKLKGTEKTKYKKDYDWARGETLRLIFKNIEEEKDPAKLGFSTAKVKDFQGKLGSALPPKENAKLTALLQTKYKPLFLAEISRIQSLKKPVEFASDWYNLKTYYEGLTDVDKKSLCGQYIKAFKTIFERLVRSIMAWKPKTPSTPEGKTLQGIEVMSKKIALDSLYKDLPDELKSKLKSQYNKAQKHLERIEKGSKR